MSPDFFRLQTAQPKEFRRLNKDKTALWPSMLLVLFNLVILRGCAFCNRAKSRDKRSYIHAARPISTPTIHNPNHP
jgi:hypothetical protein